jgi:prepilin peptidase CpaA
LPALPTWLLATVALLSAIAAASDLRARRIPNWLTLSGVLAGFGLNAMLLGWSGLSASGLGLALAFALYFPLYLLRGMGAGDVKLMAALGSLLGPMNWFWVFVYTAFAGGIFVVTVLPFQGRFKRVITNVGYAVWEMIHFRPPYLRTEELDVRSDKSFRLPHGVFIALGVAAFLLFGGLRS